MFEFTTPAKLEKNLSWVQFAGISKVFYLQKFLVQDLGNRIFYCKYIIHQFAD